MEVTEKLIKQIDENRYFCIRDNSFKKSTPEEDK